MKFLSNFLVSLFASLALATGATAQTYPVTNPTYIPSAIELPTTCTAACDVTFNVSGVSTVTLQLVGAPGAITASVQGTNQASSVASPTWTTLNMVPINGGPVATSTSAVGFWTVNTVGLTKIRAHVSALTGSVAVNMVGSPSSASIQEFGTASDPCQSPAVVKSSVAVNIASATTTQLVALSGTTKVYVCGFSASMMGTTPAITFEYGTGTTCGTGTTALTGAFAPTAGSVLNIGQGGTAFAGIAGNALCALSGGTPSIQGVLTYVQQ
jgi:hypothetical protein